MKDYELIRRLNRLETDIKIEYWINSGTLYKNILRQKIEERDSFSKEYNLKLK